MKSIVTATPHLLLADERTPQHADTLAHHGDVKLVVVLEEVHDLLQRRVVLELKAVPERPLRFIILVLGSGDRLRESEERQCQVHEAILVVLQLVLAINYLNTSQMSSHGCFNIQRTDLVKFQAHETCDERCRRRNGRNDLASNLLGGVTVGDRDIVIHRPQVSSSSDEINVVVCIIILLKLNRIEAVASQR